MHTCEHWLLSTHLDTLPHPQALVVKLNILEGQDLYYKYYGDMNKNTGKQLSYELDISRSSSALINKVRPLIVPTYAVLRSTRWQPRRTPCSGHSSVPDYEPKQKAGQWIWDAKYTLSRSLCHQKYRGRCFGCRVTTYNMRMRDKIEYGRGCTQE